jgi:hypothetical protein
VNAWFDQERHAPQLIRSIDTRLNEPLCWCIGTIRPAAFTSTRFLFLSVGTERMMTLILVRVTDVGRHRSSEMLCAKTAWTNQAINQSSLLVRATCVPAQGPAGIV